MSPDLLSTICFEIDERLKELRPCLAEHERLLEAVDALVVAGSHRSGAGDTPQSAPTRRAMRVAATGRGSAAGAIKPAASGSVDVATEALVDRKPLKQGSVANGNGSTLVGSKAKPKLERAARGAAREAILAALEHGSHTVGELAVVTAMSAPNINGNLRKLASEGAVIRTAREGKSAWALPVAVS